MSKSKAIGGIFFKCKDPQQTMQWYSKHFGFICDPQYGTSFGWRKWDEPSEKGFTAWSPMKENTDYFGKPDQQFMINYRVENLESFIAELKSEGIKVLGEIQSFEYGKFAHIEDCDGRKVELWEAIDSKYENILNEKITK